MPGVLTPYRAGRTVAKYSPYGRYYRAGYYGARAVRFAYTHRRGIKRAATTIQRAWKRRRRSYRARTTGTRTSTRQFGELEQENNLLAETAFGRADIRFPTFSDNAQANQRIGHTIKLSGIHCCWQFINTTERPIEVHWCMVQLKDREGFANTDLQTQFWRDTISITSRSRNFAPSASWDMRFFCSKLNPDKFNIITHKRRILDPKIGAAETGPNELKDGRWMWKMDKYFKINKKITFDGPTSTVPQRAFICLFWWQSVDKADFVGVEDAALQYDYFNRVYFRTALA